MRTGKILLGMMPPMPALSNLLRVGSEGRGSRVRIKLNNVRAVFHRPYPRKEVDKGSVASMRRFLENAGVKP